VNHDSVEHHVISLLKDPHAFEDIMQCIDISRSELEDILFDLQLNDTICQDPSGRWFAKL
jgi:predicted Rossmann fold nucleotide-binding protein DprA/Smf involved in DNA uptake